MAQAARLSLRMQKELKLLLSDPPPGASFPYLSEAGDAALFSPSSSSSSSSSSSLTAIDAEIEGPEGTVYAGGIFKIRIQIPERYPFQPPVVTFATPIYHPNIDNGGRICLDILNLPPKGAWQPSLNISTVITSIGLLLSEPNPDDGLMCDASWEFKYNKQAFDLKARTMTEKYAKATSEMVSSIQGTQQTVELKMTGDIEVGHEIKTEDSSKPPGVCKKLSLDLSVSRDKKDSNAKANELTDPIFLEFKKGEPEESSQKLNTDDVQIVGNSNIRKKQKLSLSSLSQAKQSECDNQNIQAVNGSRLQSSQASNCNQQEEDMDFSSQGNVSTNSKRHTGSKKLSLGFSVMSRNQEWCQNETLKKLTGERPEKSKENVSSNSGKPEFAKQGDTENGNVAKEKAVKLCDVERDNCKLFLQPQDISLSDPKPCSHNKQQQQQPDPSLTVIVLDSDESDEEEDMSRCRRSKLSLLSKRHS